jgi:cytochrome c
MLLKTLRTGGAASAMLAVALLCPMVASAAECSLPAEAQDGKLVSNQCKSCHVFEADKPSRPTAPNLHEVFGAMPASRRDFQKYSEGMQGAAAHNAQWTEDALFDYLADPKAYLAKVNGADVRHAMYFQLKDEKKRRDIIAYLKAIKRHPECE